ncbi:MAG TPA: hypothetical protein VMY42_25630 [Thermoguttaceae bacterium]|nr:hypothetical protein [Thermoguttaceae bacterium]
MPGLWWIAVVVGTVSAVLLLYWRSGRAAALEARFARARKGFHLQRERLEAKFVQLAAAKARPNGPQWTESDFDDGVAYVRNRKSGELLAFGGLTVPVDEFEDAATAAISDLIGNLRSGTVIFRFDGKQWDTDGRAILNLSPDEAIRFYRNDLEMIDQELARRA